ncbi:MAG: hypothetical protein E6J34_23770 [Chloroflexi bacterium]|nr:MAG: hypothetical protein E6J34_23770 [Chloroflexota bacterium]
MAYWSKGCSFRDVQMYPLMPPTSDGSFGVQIFESLKFLGERGILHCDLKPSNIVVVGSGLTQIKIIDFGSSRYDTDNNTLGEDSTLQTQWYRAPEIILGMPYDMAIDMWSAGCILAELYIHRHLFPGQDESDQLARIMEVVGLPEKSFIERSPRKERFFDESCNPNFNEDIVGEKGVWRRKSIYDVLNCKSEDKSFVSLIWHCLQMNPRLRISPKNALHHRFMMQDLSSQE